jgi:hypothetical protein
MKLLCCADAPAVVEKKRFVFLKRLKTYANDTIAVNRFLCFFGKAGV